jgi:hypothetical protein
MRLGLLEPPPGPLSPNQLVDGGVSPYQPVDGVVLSEAANSVQASKGEGSMTAVGADPESEAAGTTQQAEWVELRPRWPLTMERHPSCMPTEKLRSAKKVRMHMSLTEMTTIELERIRGVAHK